MKVEELCKFLEEHPHVEWALDDEGNLYIRHSLYDGPHEKIKIEPKALSDLSKDKLERLLVNGRNIEHITRVTGYFSRVSGWNKGKKGELKERQRVRVS